MAKRSLQPTGAQPAQAVMDPPTAEATGLTVAKPRRPLTEAVDQRTGELTYVPESPFRTPDAPEEPDVEQWARNATYVGLSERPVSDEQAKALLAPVQDAELLIKPDMFGAVYLSHPGYRRRLNAAFKPGGWGLRRISPYEFDGKMVYAEYAMFAEGRCLAVAKGEQLYQGEGGSGTNDQMTKGDAVEGLKSNALMRCCKDLGMAMECWDKSVTDRWRQAYCFRVWKDGKPAWRKMTDPPLYKENGVTDDSPNRDKYTAQARTTGVRSPQPTTAAAQTGPPASTSNGTNGTYTGKGDPNKIISDKQVKYLWAKVFEKGLDQDDVAEYLKATFNVAKSKDLTNGQLDEALKWVAEGAEPRA